ncbi:MAG TPA: AAA family ATPase [Thermodesulfobacteriota bacterium]|nr:AAA family ATPase [Thermodesulfobacteriota bacterium]
MNSQKAIINEIAYANSWEHLSDELKRLDIILHLHMLKQRNSQPAGPLDGLRGLVLSEEEIASLLEDVSSPSAEEGIFNSSNSETQTLFQNLRQLESQIEMQRALSLEQGIYLSLPHLSQLFHLIPFEQQCLLICLAPELDRKYEKLYAYLQDDITRKKPSVDLVLSLGCRTVEEKLKARLALDPQASLIKYRLLQMTDNSQDGSIPLLSRFLMLDDRIVNFLLGFNRIDARLESTARLVFPQTESGRVIATEEVQNQIRGFLNSYFNGTESVRQNVVFYFHGPYGSGCRSLAEVICCDIGSPLIIGDVEKMVGGQLPFEEAIWLLGRETVLQHAALCLENFDVLLAEGDKYRSQLQSLLEVIRTFSRLTFLLGSRPWRPQGLFGENIFIDLEFRIPDDMTRIDIWKGCLSNFNLSTGDLDLSELASKFRFSPGQIQDAVVTARNLARWRSPEDGQITGTDLYAACRAQSNQKLSTLARKIEPKYTWDDIVLPADQMAQLREICIQSKYRHIVYGEWGFDRKLSLGKGLNVLFSGPSGTGKTMAAEVITNELGIDLYKIDLSQVVSKYIGETEKNLDKIFTEAQASNAILFFDEADALFGKRSEVKDAHDRYANIEIGYLLQKMEEYDGIAILATNLRQNMDEAFVRRIHIIVEFPFPDEEYRGRIWKVVFPREAPLGDDVDLSVLAREVKLPGGNIRNISLAAAFYAAGEGGVIRMHHLVQAVRREYQKLGRIWNEAEWRTKGILAS